MKGATTAILTLKQWGGAYSGHTLGRVSISPAYAPNVGDRIEFDHGLYKVIGRTFVLPPENGIIEIQINVEFL